MVVYSQGTRAEAWELMKGLIHAEEHGIEIIEKSTDENVKEQFRNIVDKIRKTRQELINSDKNLFFGDTK